MRPVCCTLLITVWGPVADGPLSKRLVRVNPDRVTAQYTSVAYLKKKKKTKTGLLSQLPLSITAVYYSNILISVEYHTSERCRLRLFILNLALLNEPQL